MPEATIEAVRALSRRTLAWSQGTYYWGDAIAYDGLLAAEPHIGAEPVDALAERVTCWAESAPPSWDDSLAPGRAIAELYRQGRIGQEPVLRCREAMSRLPRTPEGIPLLRPHVPEWRDLVWIDSLYHLPTTLAALGETLGEDALILDAARIADQTVEVLALDHGLAHAWDAGLQVNNGVPWTRGLGWALLGLLDLHQQVGPRASGLASVGQRLLTDLIHDRRADGEWATVLGDEAASTETSVAAFVLSAVLHPAADPPGTHASFVTELIEQVRGHVDARGSYLGVSHDTHVRWATEPYRNPPVKASPWGQGAALRGLVAALRTGPAVESAPHASPINWPRPERS